MGRATPVAIIDTFSARPAFHAHRRWNEDSRQELPDGLRVVTSRTVCGEIIHQARWYPEGKTEAERQFVSYDRHAIRLRFDQAVLFARPCRRCYPEGAS